MLLQFLGTNKKPLTVYLLSIVSIFIALFLIPNYVITFVAALFLLVPYLFGNGINFQIKPRPFVMGMIISVAILAAYISIFYFFTNNPINFGVLSWTIVLTHLVVISFPEEAFFRGYLQQKLGNNIKSIVVVSILFAIGHFLTICIAKGSLGLHCLTALLTFFPSLVMGYLYYKSKSIWECTIFHFLANLAFILTSGYSIFY